MVQTRMSVFIGIDLIVGWLCPPVEHLHQPSENPPGDFKHEMDFRWVAL